MSWLASKHLHTLKHIIIIIGRRSTSGQVMKALASRASDKQQSHGRSRGAKEAGVGRSKRADGRQQIAASGAEGAAKRTAGSSRGRKYCPLARWEEKKRRRYFARKTREPDGPEPGRWREVEALSERGARPGRDPAADEIGAIRCEMLASLRNVARVLRLEYSCDPVAQRLARWTADREGRRSSPAVLL